MKTIQTSNAPAAIGPYSQAKVVNGFVFALWSDSVESGDRRGGRPTIEAQAEQVMKKCRSDSERGWSRF